MQRQLPNKPSRIGKSREPPPRPLDAGLMHKVGEEPTPLFCVIFHQPETMAPAAVPSLLTLYAKERVKWLIVL